ncbi:putative dGTPase [Marvinbryantia formatexigens DSM 14469]|uniref:DGTPase n=1 Tax=Marvinbryantia formatexigens DSM 14469 TaxID=478749 RepID=C6LAW8_9FIRM|nr:deoxyguanosinetriphosphate triphosphohydrolase [Marvinbryantia formatexigens]EET62099.1 putative dGTPase [Marvinbryantia formatexigens DSM 14469]UWO26544.1 deoxyguanosinetriphosphate triphosphohydrolase [Marvinbryantia formatexigens DSM 14469]SDF76636.1 dGTPase [Marvinbryantia formatexigens]
MNWTTLLCTERIRSHAGGTGSADLRSEFEKDYHRIIGSASFRRLQDKTQVFPLDNSDFIRTRLTHSLEVASIARSLGQNISQYIIRNQRDRSFDLQTQSDVCSIVECAGLIHDIGNPPFGHFGETTIRDWFRENLPRLTFEGRPLPEILSPQMLADFYNFEGNAQALRLVTKLHFLVDENGMNLTCALLGTIIKYPVSSLEVNKSSGNIKDKKPGYFYADRDIFEKIQTATGTNGRRHPLCFILEAADDIAYLTADIEDAYRKGFISYRLLLEELRSEEVLTRMLPQEQRTYLEMVSRLERKYENGLKRGVADPEGYAVSNWIVTVQGFLISCATYGFTKNYRAIMEGSYPVDLFCRSHGSALHDRLSDIAWRYVFVSRPIFKTELAAATVLQYLLDKFIPAAINYDTGNRLTDVQDKLMTLVSENYKSVYRRQAEGKSPQERLYLRLLLITDHICGMTDSYAKRLYQELNGID